MREVKGDEYSSVNYINTCIGERISAEYIPSSKRQSDSGEHINLELVRGKVWPTFPETDLGKYCLLVAFRL